MTDLIDRAQAMKLLSGEAIGKYPQSFYFGLFAATKEIDGLPAVDAVEVKHGKWSHVAGGRTICNQCGEYPLYNFFGRQAFSNYCPRCGAKMEGIGCD